ncbi:hypothetical protein IAG25_15845 [Caballeronia sp. EK]|uniref:hypothetical protein n=1 Tax=Caballeronia sp. EK TaxID=2767469 RepID=UPI001656236B|nr:hypothetical protein [Caballeronia sp. EK]MBC8638293.1 hypothetical protein [Caballeronia sp. EK]
MKAEHTIMAHARILKPTFFRNDVLGHLPPYARLLFAGLWTLADRDGRLEDRPGRIKVDLFPYDIDLSDDAIDAHLELLNQADLIERYCIGSERLIAITKWKKHQRPHPREAPSELSAPLANARQSRMAYLGSCRESPRQTLGEPLQAVSSVSSVSSEKNLKPEGTNDDNSKPRVRARGSGPVSSSPALTVVADEADTIARAAVSVQRARQAIADAVIADLRDHGVQRVAAAREPIAYAVNAGATLDLFAEARKVGARSKGEVPVTANFVLGIVRNWLAEGHTPKAANGHAPQGEFYRDKLARKAHGLTTVSGDEPSLVIESTEAGHVRKPS